MQMHNATPFKQIPTLLARWNRLAKVFALKLDLCRLNRIEVQNFAIVIGGFSIYMKTLNDVERTL